MHREYCNPQFRICARGNLTRSPSHGIPDCRPPGGGIGLNALFRAVLEPAEISMPHTYFNFCLSANKKKQ